MLKRHAVQEAFCHGACYVLPDHERAVPTGARAAAARQQQGQIDNLVSAGSVENITRLLAAQTSCTIHFALVQDGMDWPAGQALELIGRLSKAESLVFLGPDADRIRALTDPRGKRIGIGPIGSGTEAVRDRQLQILNIPDADALARRLPFTRVGRIVAGQYDPVRHLPGEDKRVLRIDTLLMGNRCARRSATPALLTVLATVFPDCVRDNRDRPNLTGLRWAPAARSYVDNEGPDIVGVYMPWGWTLCRRRAGSSSSSVSPFS